MVFGDAGALTLSKALLAGVFDLFTIFFRRKKENCGLSLCREFGISPPT